MSKFDPLDVVQRQIELVMELASKILTREEYLEFKKWLRFLIGPP